MIRVLFLLLFLMSSVAFAQEETPKAVKYGEFKAATNGYVKMIMDGFYVELGNNPSSQGYIINYGTDREITIREKQFRNAIDFFKLDGARITLVRGGLCNGLTTELWIVPPGADYPAVCSDGAVTPSLPNRAAAAKLEEFGEVSNKFLTNIFAEFFEKVKNGKTVNGYIVIRGTEKGTAEFENRIRDLENFKFYNSEKIIFLKKVETRVQTTVALWFVPQGAELPKEIK